MTDFQELDDHIRSLFSPEHLPASLAMLEQLICDWAVPRQGNVFPHLSYEEIVEKFYDVGVPQSGCSEESLIRELREKLLEYTPKLNHPRYLGHMTQALPLVSVALEGLVATINQNQVKLETAFASTLIEKQVLNWLHKLVYNFDDSFYAGRSKKSSPAIGNMVSGGTIGNLTALATALAHALPGVRERGLPHTLAACGYAGVAIIGSARMHYSLKKAAASLGIGTQALHFIPVDEKNRIRVDLARMRAEALEARQIKVIAFVGVAGSTETGSIDPLDALADLAEAFDTWFHVDAAWGGALLMSEAHRPLLEGIGRADSVVIDGHKLFYVPMAQGTVLFRNEQSLQLLRHHANYILRPASGDLGQTSLEGSRRFDALKLWATLKLLGTEGYARLYARASGIASHMRTLVEHDDEFELITYSDTFILTYRFVPAPWREELRQQLQNGNTGKTSKLNERINRLNEELQTELKASGEGFVSRTVLESTFYSGEITVLRVVLTNPWTTHKDLQDALQRQKCRAHGLLTSFQSG